jgi:predicted 2-oxoglutarate/Fe(II)-dependent dioxygenase YbiX
MKKSDHLYKQFIYQKVFSEAECNKIITIPGMTQNSLVVSDGGFKLDDYKRDSITTFINHREDTDWLFKKISDVIIHANNNYFNFQIQDLINLQLLEYNPGHFFSWHYDLGAKKSSTRKISAIVMLSKPDDYKGGLLKFMFNEKNTVYEQGDIILFPSYIPHMVEKVTEGKRFTLVTWACGTYFS